MQILLRLGILGTVGLSVLPEGSVLPSTKGEVKTPSTIEQIVPARVLSRRGAGPNSLFPRLVIVNLIPKHNLSSMAIYVPAQVAHRTDGRIPNLGARRKVIRSRSQVERRMFESYAALQHG
jgi:hypothetical protein